MQCANLKKRSLEAELDPWNLQAKRACLEAELQAPVCPMETSHSFSATSQRQQVLLVQPRPQLRCPRCLAGEPGHIKHILGL